MSNRHPFSPFVPEGNQLDIFLYAFPISDNSSPDLLCQGLSIVGFRFEEMQTYVGKFSEMRFCICKISVYE